MRGKKEKSAGINVCDCHDMLSACLAMTKEKELFAMTKREQITQYTIHII